MKDLSNENVIHIVKDGVQYLQFRKLLEYSDILAHGYSLGIDKNFRTARAKNAEPITKEELEEAKKDYSDLCNALETNYIDVVKPNQAHTKNVKKVEKHIKINEPDFNLKEYDLIDGLITNKPNTLLATTNADCILLMFFDPIKKAIANIHSGWKGTLQRISVETVEKMRKEYGSNSKDIICCICPSIRKCHFEVEKDVQTLFENEFKDLKLDEIIERKSENKWLIDTVKINEEILQKAGLKKENIVDCGICSVCNSDLIHSYRVEKEKYGLSTAIIGLK